MPVKLNANLAPGGDVPSSSFQISSDASHVVYRSDQNVNNDIELFARPLIATADDVFVCPKKKLTLGDAIEIILVDTNGQKFTQTVTIKPQA